MRILVCPDSYKGVLDAESAARVMERAAKSVFPRAEIDFCPMADGGEGTLSIWARAVGAHVMDVPACDPFGNPIACQAAVRENTGEVLLEAAQTCGLPSPECRAPACMLSSGLGLAMKNVLAAFPKARIRVALGGTGTVDGGLGAAMALGLRAFSRGQEIRPSGPLDLPEDLQVEFASPFENPPVFLCDTKAVLLGPAGAVALFGAQKGVRAEEAPAFERSLSVFAQAVASAAKTAFSDFPGFGAAGGMAMPFCLLCGATCAPGARTLMQAVDFFRRVRDADLVITGEGRLDATSLTGKLVGEIYAICRNFGKETWVFPGQAAAFQVPPGMCVFPASSGETIPEPGTATRELFRAVTEVLEKFCKNLLS